MKKLFICLICLSLFSCIKTKKYEQTERKVNLIFDSDFGPDYDDVGAIVVMHALADSGKVNILATIASTKYPKVAQTLSVFNSYFGRSNIPIGVPQGWALNIRDWQGWTDSVTFKYPHNIKSNNEAYGAISLYRKTLAEQADTSVTIVTVGFTTNLANLLKSKADKFSDLPGKQLVAQKVKRLISMAGNFPKGKEFNILKDSVSSMTTFSQWPTEIIFSGFEIGSKIHTGLPLINNDSIKLSPVKDVYQICISKSDEDKDGRMSWDQTAVLVAIMGVSPYYNRIEGKIITFEDGSNSWDPNGKGHFYLIESWKPTQVEMLINTIMMHQPIRK